MGNVSTLPPTNTAERSAFFRRGCEVKRLDRPTDVRAAIYTRISRDRVGAGLGVQRQREDCERLIADRSWICVGFYSDNDISAYSGKPRPGYRQLLADIRADRLDAVIAWHADRLHRSPVELEDWIEACERHGVATITVRAGELDLSTAAGRMVARMLGAAARHESELKSERIRRVRAQEAQAGRAHGRLGYGYRRDPVTGAWQVVDDEARIIREIAGRLLGGESLRAIARELNRRGVPTPRCSPCGWRSTSVRHLVAAGRHCGFREWTPAPSCGGRGRGYGMGPLVARGDWPPILRREQTEKIRDVLRARARSAGRTSPRELHSQLGPCPKPPNYPGDRNDVVAGTVSGARRGKA